MRAEPVAPRTVAILVLPGAVPFDVGIAGQIFGDPMPLAGVVRYRMLLCGLAPGLVTLAGGVPLGVQFGLEALSEAETIVVPGLNDVEAPVPTAALDALRDAARRGIRVMSICTGAFILAEAGLLDDRAATTHWAHAARLAQRFPRVRVDPRVLYIDDGQILTSAGLAAGIDLSLHVVRLDFGTEVANAVARNLVMAPHRSGGQAQFIEQPIPDTSAHGLDRTMAWALEHLDRPLTVTELARHANTSVRHFSRRFRAETGVQPQRWLLSQRVLAARRLLETTDLSIAQIAARVGLGSAATLRVHFRRALGTTPLAYRQAFRA